ncbi:MAG: hypothetical protein HN576_09815 [Bacteriovoracaceae bacterium]|nr:hypothetical protein [Bacteriovoracaceae bacterium]
MNKIILVFLLALLFPSANYAAEKSKLDELKSKVRGYVSQYIGEDIASKVFGTLPVQILLPKIPKIICSSKDENCDKAIVIRTEDELSKVQKEKYNLSFLQELHLVTRNRKADKNFVVKWMNVMNQGASREGVYRALVLDNTYAGLENFENPLNDATIEFAIGFLKKFVGKKVKATSLESLNFYSLKRIATERSLEIIDELSKRPEDLSRWYAVFSADIAESFPSLWNKNKVRKNTSAPYHLAWANKAPSQHLRSEVIIKLHLVFNSLSR